MTHDEAVRVLKEVSGILIYKDGPISEALDYAIAELGEIEGLKQDIADALKTIAQLELIGDNRSANDMPPQ